MGLFTAESEAVSKFWSLAQNNVGIATGGTAAA